MQTRPTDVQPSFPSAASPNVDWSGADEIETQRAFPDLISAALCIVGGLRRWAKRVLWLCNVIVAPVGLKSADQRIVQADNDYIDFFPVLSKADEHIMLGSDGRHLDFRILLKRQTLQSGARYRLTTLVKRQSLFGLASLFVITPFRKWIVKSVLTNAL